MATDCFGPWGAANKELEGMVTKLRLYGAQDGEIDSFVR